MGESVDWQERTYHETFEAEVRGLERRRAADPDCTVTTLEGVLQHLYHMDGADWGGRGDVQDITLAATIAAYEYTLAQWQASGTRASDPR
ncbi:MAG: hypothetical protein LBD74_00995 [Spirochaetaceae bacterium]|jgi:hypothetical protein|nr:hypothetical protein [Spirochaetaceae bacterium]